MSKDLHCTTCKKELTGAIELKFAAIGSFVIIVARATPDCNWARCKFCHEALCKSCLTDRNSYCCIEAFLAANSAGRLNKSVGDPKTVPAPPG
jgi:hypothetical protein